MHEKQILKPPPCEECRPRLTPEQEDIAEIYNKVSTQMIISFGGAIDLDYKVLAWIFDLYEIPRKDQKRYFETLRTMFRVFVTEQERPGDKI